MGKHRKDFPRVQTLQERVVKDNTLHLPDAGEIRVRVFAAAGGIHLQYAAYFKTSTAHEGLYLIFQYF